jgi:hypothetical protein
VATHRPVLAATRAAGTIVGRPTLARGALAHAIVTTWWTTVLAVVLPRRSTGALGAVAGLMIGRLDLELARRHFPAIAALPRRAQLADHVAFGLLVGGTFARGEPRRGTAIRAAVQVRRPATRRRRGGTAGR